ncbi:hypothetical protein PV10_08917 [Exophiala mesophila]|uniref:Uncharacterized protein n=1 Tax=Exophiala mesophila TaxID=212818 RepID=A0A0D1Z3J0_EXOME|nr:uncharacterized protein PV10_08917 [Exophiala mesophila]KIV89342.1 hypothetical protein PV10_08917 [Exophiala mesophila]
MPPRSRHSKSASVGSSTGGSTAVASTTNGEPLAPGRSDKSSSPASTRKPRSRPTTSSENPIVVIPSSKSKIEPVVSPAQDYSFWKFVSTLVLSTTLEIGLQTIAGQLGTGDLAAISRKSDSWVEISGLLGWKVVQLAIYWYGGFDAYDVASLSLLQSTPTTLLLGLFYKISPTTLLSTTLSSLVSLTLPYYLLRPLSPAHSPASSPKSLLRNRSILTDPYTTIATSLLSAAIFAVLLEAALATALPTWLVTHFRGLKTLEAAHLGPAGLPTLLLALLPAGLASQEFIFAPSTASPAPLVTAIEFDPATATLASHVKYNAWGWYSVRQKTLISRTILLTVLVVIETLVHAWGTIEGVELEGALGYAGIWGFGTTLVGLVLNWVGGPSD